MNARRKTNRRQFLKGESARDALASLSFDAGTVGDAPLGPGSERRAPRRRTTCCKSDAVPWPATSTCIFTAGQDGGAVEAATEALDLVARLEDQLTVFRPQSEVSAINREAADRACVVESRLFELLCRCVDWHSATGGAYDITAGPLVKVWGFFTRSGRFPAAEDVTEALQRVGSQNLELDREQRTIRFARPGMELNLGSVGKGYALDRCAEVLEAAGVSDFLIHGGQSSVLVRGTRYADSEIPEWCIALRHPLRPSDASPN